MNASHAMTIRRRGKSWIAKLLSRRVPEPPRQEPVRMVIDDDMAKVEAIRKKLADYQPCPSKSLFIDDFGAAPLRQPIRDPRELRRR